MRSTPAVPFAEYVVPQGVAANGKAISSFGEILSQGNIPRFVQLALRFYF
jgi:hypothetical protein